MLWSFAAPAPELARYVGTYYFATSGRSTIDDIQRADSGHFRMFFEGSGYQDFASGKRFEAPPAALIGPTNQCHSYSVSGPLRFFGVSLLPAAWGGLFPVAANELADGACDAAQLVGPPVENLYLRMRECDDIGQLKALADAFFLRCLRPIPSGHRRVIEAIRAWLAAELAPDVATLYEQLALSERQVARIANRYWGAPPKALARKYAALRTASWLVEHGGEPNADAVAHYADRSHLIREVRRVTGQTPRQLKTLGNFIMRASLHPANFRELEDRG